LRRSLSCALSFAIATLVRARAGDEVMIHRFELPDWHPWAACHGAGGPADLLELGPDDVVRPVPSHQGGSVRRSTANSRGGATPLGGFSRRHLPSLADETRWGGVSAPPSASYSCLSARGSRTKTVGRQHKCPRWAITLCPS